MARILLAEDNALQLDVLKKTLTEHTLFTARNGRTALAIALKERPDLVISDVMMPGMDGYALLREIRNNAELQNTRVILISVGKMQHDEAYLADAYLNKPYSLDVLEDLVRRLTRR